MAHIKAKHFTIAAVGASTLALLTSSCGKQACIDMEKATSGTDAAERELS